MATDATTSVIVIEYTPNGLPLAIQGEKLSMRRFQVINEKQINKIIRDMSPTATVIVDTEAFHGHGSLTARKYVRAIREVYDEKPSVLFLRYGAPSDDIIENDKLAGATDVLYHSALTGTNDAKRMNHFIREGVLPPPPERKKPVGNVSGIINALHYHEQSIGNLADDEDTNEGANNPAPSNSVQTPPRGVGVALKIHAGTPVSTRIPTKPVTVVSEKIPEPSVIPPAENELGAEEMEALLAAVNTIVNQNNTIVDQNNTILELLKVIVPTVQSLHTEKRAELLAEIQKKLGAVFAQLLTGNPQEVTATPVVVPSPATLPAALEVVQPATSIPEMKMADPLATVDKLPGKNRKGCVTLYGKAVTLPFNHARLFAHLINTGETMGVMEVAKHSGVTALVGGGYLRSLIRELGECKRGLSSCLILVKSSRSKLYRFDDATFRKVFSVI